MQSVTWIYLWMQVFPSIHAEEKEYGNQHKDYEKNAEYSIKL